MTRHPLTGLGEREHVRLVNCLSGFRNLFLVGTANTAGKSNLAPFSSVFHVGANPPLLGMLSRPPSVPRHTLENIRATGCWTLNAITRDMIEAAHKASARFDRDQSEFEATGLRSAYRAGFPAPFVAGSPLSIGLRLREDRQLEANDTVLVVGEIVTLDLDRSAIHEDGWLDLEALGLVAVSGLDSYHETRRIGRLHHAKPEFDTTWIEGGST